MIDRYQIELIDVIVTAEGYLRCYHGSEPMDAYDLLGYELGPIDPHADQLRLLEEIDRHRIRAVKELQFERADNLFTAVVVCIGALLFLGGMAYLIVVRC